MGSRKDKMQLDPDAAALTAAEIATSPALPDNPDPPGLPLALVLLDAAQPDNELGHGDPPPLIRPSVADCRWTAKHPTVQTIIERNAKSNVTSVFSGGPRALHDHLHGWWASHWDGRDIAVSTAGWCLYRHWEGYAGRTRDPAWIVMEFPAMTPDGRCRIRAVVHPCATRMTSQATVSARSAALSPVTGTLSPAAEAAESLCSFAERWRKRRT
jgi:hypothetical protein